MRRRRLATLMGALFVLAGGALSLHALYLPAKALLAQALLERAFRAAEAGAGGVRPWPWADIRPVARLSAPRLDAAAIVLQEASGEAMAFGPGHLPQSAPLGAPGTAVIAAHRDTHFAFLKDLAKGDVIELSRPGATLQTYRVRETRVVMWQASGLEARDGGPTGMQLALVTCYPFGGVVRGPWRYVVLADAMGSPRASQRL